LPHNIFFREIVAELSAVVICKAYNIPINLSSSKFYIDSYNESKELEKISVSALGIEWEVNKDEIVERVSLIYEFLKLCVEDIKNKNNCAKRFCECLAAETNR
jgi:hypothetical protein